ncbi:MAG: hypothetical protein H7Z72_15745 [Bacteroidetes bacterium]|nr:hypothetical protein [Fibrella sp.]
MNGMSYGRFLGSLFLLIGVFILSLEYYGLQDKGVYHFKFIIVGFIFLFLGLAFIVRPGASDIRIDWSDDFDDRQDKGRSWIAAIKAQRPLLWFYGGALLLALLAAIYTNSYLQAESLTDWTFVLRLVIALAAMGIMGWWFTRPTKA